MSRIVLLLVLSVGAFVACEARVRAGGVRLGTNPGAIIKIRRSALDAVFKGAAQIAPRIAKKAPIPDATATFGGTDMETSNIRITDFAEPKIEYTLSSPNKISGSVELPSVTIQGPFNATRRTFIKTQKDGGHLNFNANNIKVTFRATIGEFENGVPMIQDFECESAMGKANLKVDKCKEKFGIEVIQLAAQGFRPIVTTQTCSVVKKLVSGQLNKLLARIPNVVDITPNVGLKYQVKPTVADDFVQVAFFGKVLTDEVSPFTPAKFAEIADDSAMVIIKISDAPFNDLAYQAYENKKMEFTINQNSPKVLYTLVVLKCDPANEACLGNVAPAMAAKYGEDALVEVVVKALKAPEVEFLEGKATFKGALSVDLSVTCANDTSKPYHEANAMVDVSGSLKIKIQAGILYAKIDIDQVTVRIDEEHNQKWQDKIKNTIKKVVETYVNDNLLKGLPLRLPFGVGVNDPLIKFAAHTMQAQCAFDYKVTSSEEK